MRSGSRKPGEQRMGDTNQSRSAEGRIQRQVLEELERRASKDVLSGLLNRAALEHRIQNRLEDMTQEETCALFIVDLDNFKQVNDTLGHRAGDQAIRQSARSALLCRQYIAPRHWLSTPLIDFYYTSLCHFCTVIRRKNSDQIFQHNGSVCGYLCGENLLFI